MASTNIKIFDENKGNLMADEAYAIDSQRVNGVQSGIASSQLQNKTLFQVSLMAYALAQIMNQNGIDANDYDAVSTFVNNLSSSLLQKVNDKASTAQAQAGTDNTKWMTPALVKAWWDNMYNSLTLPASRLTGTLPVANGGTGMASDPALLVDLARTTTASPFSANPRPGVTGILPVASGGTGQNSLPNLKTAMGIKRTQLYNGTLPTPASSNASTPFTLSDNIENYDIVNIVVTTIQVDARGSAFIRLVENGYNVAKYSFSDSHGYCTSATIIKHSDGSWYPIFSTTAINSMPGAWPYREWESSRSKTGKVLYYYTNSQASNMFKASVVGYKFT